MTAALVDAALSGRATAPAAAAAVPGQPLAETADASPGTPPRPRRPRPHLLPVPDCEPPLRSPQDDDLTPTLSHGDLAATALFGGRVARWADPPRPSPGDVTTAPPMTHRRWPVDARLRREFRAGSAAEPPHRLHSAAGSLATDDDAAWPAVPPPADLSSRPRASAFATASMLVRATIEALAGLRPIVQLQPYYSAGVFAGLQEFPMLGHRRDTQLVSLWVCEPNEESAEVSVAFRCGPRIRAMAMQLRAQRDRWFVTSLQLA